MSSLAESKGPLLAAIQAIVIKAIQEGGRKGARELTGVAERTLCGWMRTWGFDARARPEVPKVAIDELLSYLGIETVVYEEIRADCSLINVEEIIHADCSLVQITGVPDEVRNSIETATELLMTGQSRKALQELLTIQLPRRVAQGRPTQTAASTCR